MSSSSVPDEPGRTRCFGGAATAVQGHPAVAPHYTAECRPGTQTQISDSEGKFKGKSLLYANVVMIELLVGLGVGDNNCLQVEDSSAQSVGAWPLAVLLWQHVKCFLLLLLLLL